eukprot:93196_1
MLTLLFAILLPFAQSGKASGGIGAGSGAGAGAGAGSGAGDGGYSGTLQRRLLQAAFPLPTATEATGNGIGNAAGSGATEMECILSNKDPAGCAARTTNMVHQ